jgi:hypothetical protein
MSRWAASDHSYNGHRLSSTSEHAHRHVNNLSFRDQRRQIWQRVLRRGGFCTNW